MSKTEDKPTTSNSGEASETDAFFLERLYPEPAPLFQAHEVGSVNDPSILVAFDTNALLLPYQIRAGNATEVGKVLDRLSADNRLFVPGRVAREFARNRDAQLATIITSLNKRRAPLPGEMPPLIGEMKGCETVNKAYAVLSKAHKEYVSVLDKLVSEIKNWRGNDPVALIYARVFNEKAIIDLPMDDEARKSYLAEMKWRYPHKVPPGYKDAGKEDGGIGDFLIWKSLLKLGEREKKNLVFITGEQKADWFIRADGGAVYPRSELIDEYRRASGGKSFCLMSFYALLEEMKASQEVVQEVKQVEAQANTELRESKSVLTERYFKTVATDVSGGTNVHSSDTGTAFVDELGRIFEAGKFRPSREGPNFIIWSPPYSPKEEERDDEKS